MDKAKSAITDFMGKAGKHDTTVHESVVPAVQNETVQPHRHEEIATAVDKEIHQDHYHRTVQPISDREVLPEKHTAQHGAVQHREHDHRDADVTKRELTEQQAAFQNTRTVNDTTHSQSVLPTVGGEHVHHHIHETIQPVINKSTIEPHVVHTTVPIHEVHHNAAKHHATSELPAMSLQDYQKQGGVLGGREERFDGFAGEPKHIGGTLKNMMAGHNSKRDSGNTSHLNESSKHGDFDPLDGGNKVNASGVAATAGAAASGHHHHHQHGNKQRSEAAALDAAKRTV